MRIKLIEEPPMATSAELYQLSWVIERLLADPRRLVQARAHLHTGQQIRYLSWNDGKLRPAGVVGMHVDHVAVQDPAYSKVFKVHYAASRPMRQLKVVRHRLTWDSPGRARHQGSQAVLTSRSETG